MSSSRIEEGIKEHDTMGLHLQDGNTRDGFHRFYFVKFRPSPEEVEKGDAEKQYHLMTLARSRITEEIAQQKAEQHQIHRKLMWFWTCDWNIKWMRREIENLEAHLGKLETRRATSSVSRTTSYVCLTDQKDGQTPDRKRCQKRLMKKDRMDVEYLRQVREELLLSKKSSCGTQELNDLIESMEHKIRHGHQNRADEMKMYREIRHVKETRETYNTREPDPPSYQYTKERLSKRDTDRNRAMQHRIQIRHDDIDKIERDLMGRNRRVTRLKSSSEHVRKIISSLKKDLEDVNSKRIKAYKRAYELGEQNKEWESSYVEYKSLMTYATRLAQNRDVVGLKQASDTQVEGFMRQWNHSQAFKEDYEQRKMQSATAK
ncbi:hypothetical protein OSB04_014286 [Centaurea solstitialis]|uniref:Uncharacterized protein n=1 Tax=Centaurea solstitialis TaxID=347529 RepID=A0AA38T824_9ASTR|nr:hypothetical protein OSB04_014286 [Centaurea solstitialis]